jgi:hypothetical protein
VAVHLRPIQSRNVIVEKRAFSSLAEFYELSEQSDRDFEYTVAWFDCFSFKDDRLKGIMIRGRHSASGGSEPGVQATVSKASRSHNIRVPFDFPEFTLSKLTIKIFNQLYYCLQSRKREPEVIDYEPYFYPLDALLEWNRIYGRKGLLQYQFVLPLPNMHQTLSRILATVSQSRFGSFLAVLKTFGKVRSPGLLSFPQAGVTLALDFPVREGVLALLDKLDSMVLEAGGKIYPAKDARMAAETFTRMYPEWEQLEKFRDPAFSSSFWRRVTLEAF